MALHTACHTHPGTARARALSGAARARDDVTSRPSPRVCISARRNAFAGHSDLLRAPRVVPRSRASSSRGNPTRAALGGIRLLKFDPSGAPCSSWTPIARAPPPPRAAIHPHAQRPHSAPHHVRRPRLQRRPDGCVDATPPRRGTRRVARRRPRPLLRERRRPLVAQVGQGTPRARVPTEASAGARHASIRRTRAPRGETRRVDAPVFVHFHEDRRRRGSRAEDAASGESGACIVDSG